MVCPINLSIVIPCYNEAANLQSGVLDEVFAYLDTVGFQWELLISDDGSTDDGRELVKRLIAGRPNVFLLENGHSGKPAAIMAGIRQARGEYLLFTDMDQSTPLVELQKMLPYFDQFEIIIGSRQERKNFPFYRKAGSAFFRWIRRALILKDIKDTQCGFKVLRTSLAAAIFPQLQIMQNPQKVSGWKVTAFDVELLYLAQKNGCRIKEVVVRWEDRDRSLEKKKSYFKESVEMLVQIVKVKCNDRRGCYHDEKNSPAELCHKE
jgi:dolichyl-phosphate beta-glucosyltransferase